MRSHWATTAGMKPNPGPAEEELKFSSARRIFDASDVYRRNLKVNGWSSSGRWRCSGGVGDESTIWGWNLHRIQEKPTFCSGWEERRETSLSTNPAPIIIISSSSFDSGSAERSQPPRTPQLLLVPCLPEPDRISGSAEGNMSTTGEPRDLYTCCFTLKWVTISIRLEYL